MINLFYYKIKNENYLFLNGDWGLGIGDWGLGIGPNPQSPYILFKNKLKKVIYKINFLLKIKI